MKSPPVTTLLRSAGFGIGLVFATLQANAQVPANLLPTVAQNGEFVRSATVETKVIEVNENGLTLECRQDAGSGNEPFSWREKYVIRGGKLVLDAVLTPHVVPPQPAHTEWQAATKIGTSNVGPTELNAHWNRYKDYLQRVIETSQNEWERILGDGKITPAPGSTVSVTFIMDSRGGISRIVSVNPANGATDAVARACVNAITARAPYGAWTEDMVANLGTEQEVTLSFYAQ